LFICQTIVFIIIKNITMGKEKATEVTGCNSCKGGLSFKQKWILVLAAYMFGATIYSTIELVKYLSNLF